jgi:5-methylcytosine-specific restriction endonuclease McrA
MSAPDLRTLVLKKDYTPFSLFPLSVIPAYKAFTRVLNGTSELVSNYDIKIKTNNPNAEYYWPSVIRSLDPVHNVYRDTPSLTDEYLYYRDHAECQYCGCKLTVKDLTFEHVHPASKGGKTTWDNIVAACGECNSKKGDQLPKGPWAPRQPPYTPTMWELIKLRKQYPIYLEDESWKNWIGDWKGDVKVINRAA